MEGSYLLRAKEFKETVHKKKSNKIRVVWNDNQNQN